MIIVIDKDIPFAGEMFAGRAGVVAVPGEQITPATLKNADALIIRSVTKAGEQLLAGSSIRFVGTATSGFDHVDRAFLDREGIAFAHAPGCNAESVAEYVATALLELACRFDMNLGGMSIGVVGVGNVGRRVAAKAAALGMRVLLNDPPLARKTGGWEFVRLDEALTADIVTFHVPLEKTGPDRTYRLLDARKLGLMRPGSIVINTARGGVVDPGALRSALASGHLRAAVLDVWEGEPAIDTAAVGMASIATAHIAGYSADGKHRGAAMMYDALCEWKKWKKEWLPPLDSLPPPALEEFIIDRKNTGDREVLKTLLSTCCPIMRDDADLRKISGMPEGERANYFIGLRNNYPPRREFSATTVTVDPARAALVETIGGLGFPVRENRSKK
jgi:erythronate-4-phosphate dehydrogenase